jgi:hypothetical protein
MKSQKFLKQLKRLDSPIMLRQIFGHSMLPVLPPGTMVYGLKWFRKHRLKIGDVVIFMHEGKEKIKRVEQIEEGKVYLLGDHPAESTDSRDFGWLHVDEILAKVVWPHAPKHRAEGVDPYP